MPKTNKSLAKLIDTVNTNSSSNLKNIESISKDISSLKDLMIEDRALNARLRKQRSAENKNAKIFSDDLDEIRSKRNKIDSEIQSLLNEEKSQQKNQEKADKKKQDEDSTYYSKLGDKELKSGNLVSGLLFSFLGRNEKNQEEIEKENKKIDSDERKKRLEYLEDEKTENKKERQSRVDEFKKQTKTKSKSPVNRTQTPEKAKLDPSAVDRKYEQRDIQVASPEPLLIQSIIDPVTVEISKISKQCLSDLAQLFASSGGSGSGFNIPDFDLPNRRGTGRGPGRGPTGRGPSIPGRGPTGTPGTFGSTSIPGTGVPGRPGTFGSTSIPGRGPTGTPGTFGSTSIPGRGPTGRPGTFGSTSIPGTGVPGRPGTFGSGASGVSRVGGLAGEGAGLAGGAARVGAKGALKMGASLLGKIALPLTVAMAAFDGYQGATDEGVNNILSSRKGRENEPITMSDRVKSGTASIASGFVGGLIDPSTIADILESPLGEIAMAISPLGMAAKAFDTVTASVSDKGVEETATTATAAAGTVTPPSLMAYQEDVSTTPTAAKAVSTESTKGPENEPKPIAMVDRLRSGRANLLSGLSGGLIDPKTITNAMESPLGKVVESLDPFAAIAKGLDGLISFLPKFFPGLDNLKDLATSVGGAITGGLQNAARFLGFGGTESGKPVDPLVMNAEKQKNVDLLTDQMKKRGFNDKQIAAGLGVTAKESGLISKSENLDYAKTDNTRIRQLFGKRVAGKTDEELNTIKKDPEKMGEAVYGKDTDIGKGMGNTEVGDGWKYRGRGFIQLTGKSNYAAASKAIFGNDTLVQNPDLANEPAIAAQISAWYLDKRGKDMAGKMGVDLAAASQEDINRVMVSAVAGSEVKAGQGFTGTEGLDKTDAYAKQFGGDAVNRSGTARGANPSTVGKSPFGGGGSSGGGGASDSWGEQAGGNYTAKQLSESGLKLRATGDVQAAGAYLDENLVNLSKQLPSIVDTEKIASKPGEVPLKFESISGLNDAFHKKLNYKSEHTEGKAVDFTLNRKPTKEEGEKLVALLKTKGFSKVIDEYNNPSGAAIGGGHIHAEVSGTSSDKSSTPSAAGAPAAGATPEMVGKSPFGGGGDSGGGGASDSWGEPAGTVTPATKETAAGVVATPPSLMAYQEDAPQTPTAAKAVPTEVPIMPNNAGVNQFVASKEDAIGAEEAGSGTGTTVINAPQNSTVNNSQSASNKNVREKPAETSNAFQKIYNKLVLV